MASKDDIAQPSKKKDFAFESSKNASITSGNQSTRVIIRNMTKDAASITIEQQVMTTILQSCYNQNFGSHIPVESIMLLVSAI